VRYGLGVLRTSAEYRLSRMGWRRYPYLDFDHTAVQVELPSAKKDAAPEPTDTRQD
jgi:hypothetical protein